MRLTHPLAGASRPLPAAHGLLEGLTPEQAQAVQHGRGPLLLLAGPGAGKTRTLTHRAAHLITTGGARPSEILAVTFSVRAAGELRLRLADLLGHERARGVTTATFHSVCARLLRELTRAPTPRWPFDLSKLSVECGPLLLRSGRQFVCLGVQTRASGRTRRRISTLGGVRTPVDRDARLDL
jgi:hypothetical protein